MSESEETIRRCIEGDTAAFRDLVGMYQSYAYGLARRMLFNEEDAKDVVQETFIRIWKHLHRFDSRNRFTTWLYRIVTNLCYDRMRAKNRDRRKMDAFQADGHGSGVYAEDVEKQMDEVEALRTIERIVTRLHPKQRIVFTLRDLQGLNIAETAEAADMTPSAVKSNLYYARRSVRERLEKMGYGGQEEHGM